MEKEKKTTDNIRDRYNRLDASRGSPSDWDLAEEGAAATYAAWWWVQYQVTDS